MTVGITIEHRAVFAFGFSPVLTHERNASEGEFQLRTEFVSWSIAFDTKPFLAVRIEY
jgi:hypothetical protein